MNETSSSSQRVGKAVLAETGLRRPSVAVQIGKIMVGGGAPIVVQSMTNTDTEDPASTAKQIAELARAGSELVRITVNTPAAAAAVPRIAERLAMMGVDVPIIGDFHYNGHQLLENEPACAEALAKYRINPGNVGFGKKKDSQFGDLLGGAGRIFGIGIGHRLHHDRRAAADQDLADLHADAGPALGRFGQAGFI